MPPYPTQLASDLKYGLRMLRATPRLTLTAVLSLALGIGATTAIFTVVNAVLLQPLPFDDPERLVAVTETSRDGEPRAVAPANFLDWRRDVRSFAELAAYNEYGVTLTGRARPERLRAVSASGNIWRLLGVPAALGHTFTDAQDAPGAEPAAVLTYGGWHRAFGGDRSVVGTTIRLNGRLHLITGVLPASFDLFGADIDLVTSGDRAIPNTTPFPAMDLPQVRDAHFISVMGRLRAGVSIERAQAELSTVMRQLERAYPQTNTRLGARVAALREELVGESRSALLLLLGAVGCLLLIACVNVANLLLARAVAREREMGVRMALGAGRVQLVRQVLTEAVLLGAAGGAAGVLLAAWGVRALLALAPEGLPRAGHIGIDGTTLAVAVLISLATAIAFGLAPAIRASRPRPTHALHGDGTRVSEGRGQRTFQHALVVSELTLAHVLLAGAGILIASFVKLQQVDLGFSPDRLLAVELSLAPGAHKTPESKIAFNRTVLERLSALPGVQAAAATMTVPLRGAINRGVWLLDRPEPPMGQQPQIDFMIVSPGYFRTLGIPLVAGRGFTDHDTLTAPRVAIVSRAMAQKYWPAGNAIGQRVRFGGSKVAEIVGISGDVRQRDPAGMPEPLLYIPLQQDSEPWTLIAFALRVRSDPATLAGPIRDAVLAVNPDQPVARMRTIDEIADTLLAGRRFNTILLGVFSGVALLLAAIGTYGVMAYAVGRRTREIGVRMAVGARPQDVLRMVLGQGGRLVATAVGLGVIGSLATNRLLSRQLYEVRADDPAMIAAGSAALCVCAILACWIPARRAMRIEPLTALRED